MPLELSNGGQFQQLFFGDRSYLLSQVFLTNDARINLFQDHGNADLNFSQAILPTRTVVENPETIVVATPEMIVPELGVAPPQSTNAFINLIPDPEPTPITIEPQPESYFVVRYSADDDGVFEESFKWDDANDDPDAIRSMIESAQLIDGAEIWPATDSDNEGGWFERIKQGGQVKPGLYFIFEFQEGELIPEPVDAPVDRTDIENLIEDDDDLSQVERSPAELSDPLNSELRNGFPPSESVGHQEMTRRADVDEKPKSITSGDGPARFSAVAQSALLGSSLLLAQYLQKRDDNPSAGPDVGHGENGNQRNIFSKAARVIRRQSRNPG